MRDQPRGGHLLATLVVDALKGFIPLLDSHSRVSLSGLLLRRAFTSLTRREDPQAVQVVTRRLELDEQIASRRRMLGTAARGQARDADDP